MLENLSKDEIHELVFYDSERGVFWHRERNIKWFHNTETRSAGSICNNWNSRNAGKKISSFHSAGYLHGSILGERVLLHRLAWFYMTGEWPIEDIDHINGDRTDNRWCNLRCVSRHENSKNQKKRYTNTSGQTGVNFDKLNGKWLARIYNLEKKQINLGRFDTFEEAVAARKAAEIKYGYHENHGRIGLIND